MRIAILDPAAGISGDMTLGALLSLGVPVSWLEELPARLGIGSVVVRVRDVRRAGVSCKQVEFEIPEQPHGRHVGELIRLVERAPISDWVKERAVRAFRLVGDAEGRVHGVAPEKVHLHEVGAIDAVLDIVGGIEGFERLGVEAVHNLPVAVGQGWVEAAHGRLPLPAPATAILLEGFEIAGQGGSPVEGEATTPTGAALLRVLSAGAPPDRWRLAGSGWGAGRRDPKHYPNALRILLAEAASEAGRELRGQPLAVARAVERYAVARLTKAKESTCARFAMSRSSCCVHTLRASARRDRSNSNSSNSRRDDGRIPSAT